MLIAGETTFENASAPTSLPPNVSLLGRLPPDRLQQAFAESAIYLCTSRYEPFGLAPLEAALCGCAVVARDLPSLREVWGEAALFFRDEAELPALLQSLLANPAALSEARSRSRACASRYTVQRMADGYHAIFEHLLNRRRTMPHVA